MARKWRENTPAVTAKLQSLAPPKGLAAPRVARRRSAGDVLIGEEG